MLIVGVRITPTHTRTRQFSSSMSGSPRASGEPRVSSRSAAAAVSNLGHHRHVGGLPCGGGAAVPPAEAGRLRCHRPITAIELYCSKNADALPVMSFCTLIAMLATDEGRLCRSRQRFTLGQQAIREQRTIRSANTSALEQTVAGKPVGTVNSCACTLTDGK